MSENPTNEDPVRVQQFRDDMDRMKLKGASASSERWMLIGGGVLLVVGIVLGIVAAVSTINAGDSPADQRAFIAQSLLGLALVVAGGALFVRFSLGRFLRFWLVRLVYEGRADTDRLVDAIERAAGLEQTTPAAAQGRPTLPSPAPAQPAATQPAQPTTPPAQPTTRPAPGAPPQPPPPTQS